MSDINVDASNRRSTSCFMFSLRSVVVVWSNKKQPTMALSFTEAEYRDATVATYEAICLRRLLQDLRNRRADSDPDLL